METTKHTPGPWAISANGYRPDRWKISVGARKTKDFIKICEGSGDIAHAKLIAAAPDMLHALEQIRGIEAWIQDHQMKLLFQRLVYSAIEKATK
jgi:hypothetical protein